MGWRKQCRADVGAGKTVKVESAREICGSVRVGGGNPKGLWRNDHVKAAVKRKEDARKEVLGARDKNERGICLEAYKDEKRKAKRRRSKNSLEGR